MPHLAKIFAMQNIAINKRCILSHLSIVSIFTNTTNYPIILTNLASSSLPQRRTAIQLNLDVASLLKIANAFELKADGVVKAR